MLFAFAALAAQAGFHEKEKQASTRAPMSEHAEVLAEMDAITERLPLPDAAARCPMPLSNGVMTDGGFPPGDHLSKLRIRNGTDVYAFVKIIDAAQGLIGTMYLAKGGQGTIGDIPDGTYRVKFAFGGRLLADCQTLVQPERTLVFDGPVTFQMTKTVTEVAEGTLTEWSASDVEVTLYAVPEGRAETHPISLSDFNAD